MGTAGQALTQELRATEVNLNLAQENSQTWQARFAEQQHQHQQTATEADEVLRAELASARENLAQMHTTRLTAMRSHTHSIRVLEQQEASMHEAELITARERDHYFEQLVATVPSTEPQSSQASPPQQVHPQVIPPQMPPAAAAAGTPGTQQPCAYPNAESYFVDPATGLVTPITTPAEVPLPIQYAGGMPAMGSAPGTAPWRPLGQMPPGYNPLTGMYGTDPPTPAMQSATGTPQGVPSQYSIATPPVPQGMGYAGAAVRPTNPIDPLQVRDSWADNLSSRMSLGPPPSAPSIGTQSPPGFSHVTAPP
eukprot:4400957-Amphidinium_carterae.1